MMRRSANRSKTPAARRSLKSRVHEINRELAELTRAFELETQSLSHEPRVPASPVRGLGGILWPEPRTVINACAPSCRLCSIQQSHRTRVGKLLAEKQQLEVRRQQHPGLPEGKRHVGKP